MRKFPLLALYLLLPAFLAVGQDTPTPTKPTEHVIGTISAVDVSAHTVTVKEDKSGTEHVIQLANTKTLLKVPPGATDLKTATRITAGDLNPGDRVDVRGFKAESDPNGIAARSVVLMSGRDVQQMHQQEAMAWQRSTAGTVNSVDAAGQKLMITARTPQGSKSITVDAAKAQFTRYSPEHPQTPASSQLADIQVGDQVKILGEKSEDDANLTAAKIYSGSFRTVTGTVTSIASDGKSIVIKDLATKQPVTVVLGDESAVRRLPQPMAFALARRFNPDFKGSTPGAAPGAGASAGNRPGGPPSPDARAGSAGNSEADASAHRWQRPDGNNGTQAGASPDGPPHARAGNGDLSQMLERVPKIAVTDLKAGDAVLVSGSPSSANKNNVLASNVIAGVEPIFQSASPRQMQSLGDWGNALGGGAEGAMGQQP